MNKAKVETKRTTVWPKVILGLIVLIALAIRICWQVNNVFIGDVVWFHGADAWYHMRLADAMNFPNWFKWDFFAQYPDGAATGYMPLLAWLSVNDTIAAFVPPVSAAITVMFVYLIGKELFSAKVGLLAAFLVALLPGEFLYRTLLGFTDHHCLEALLMSGSIYFLLKLRHAWQYRWAAPAGIAIGLYALSWTGIGFFLMIVGLWLWWECLVAIRHNKDLSSIAKAITSVIAIACLISVIYIDKVNVALLLAVLVIPAGMWILKSIFKDSEKVLFGLTVIVPVALVILGSIIDYKAYIIPIFWGGALAYIEEAGPLTPSIAFATYGIAIFMALGALWYYRKLNPLFIIWAVILFAAAIGQRRWGYYTIMPVAILTSALTFRISMWVTKVVRPAVIGIIILFLLLPNIQNTIGVARASTIIDADWYLTLVWLRDNTPPPCEDELTYYDLGYHLESGQLEPSYGIISWWDYGHWIIRIAHRVPLTSPTQTGGIPSEFFTARSEEDANAWLKGLNTPYVIIDESLVTGKWHAVLVRAEEKEYVDVQKCFIWTLWTEQAQTWHKIYESGPIKVYERDREK